MPAFPPYNPIDKLSSNVFIAPSATIYLIAYEFYPFPGGQATYAKELSFAFTRLGYRVVVIAPCYHKKQLESLPFSIFRDLSHQKFTILGLISIFIRLKQITPNDIVIAADIRAGLASSLFRFFKTFTKIRMFHGGEIKRAENSFLAVIANRLSSLFSNRTVTNSRYTASLVRRYIGRQAKITPLGVSRYWFEEPRGDFENEELNSIPNDHVLICTVARVEPRKGQLFAIQVINYLQHQIGFKLKYIMCGRAIDDIYVKKIKNAISGNPDLYAYVGELSNEDIRKLYSKYRLMILCAQEELGKIEGYGLVINEAGAQGCPCIATGVGGITDAIIDRQTGILCSTNDIQEFSEAIQRVLMDQSFHEYLASNARIYAEQLTWETTAVSTLSDL